MRAASKDWPPAPDWRKRFVLMNREEELSYLSYPIAKVLFETRRFNFG
jgi:hypothetical protein